MRPILEPNSVDKVLQRKQTTGRKTINSRWKIIAEVLELPRFGLQSGGACAFFSVALLRSETGGPLPLPAGERIVVTRSDSDLMDICEKFVVGDKLELTMQWFFHRKIICPKENIDKEALMSVVCFSIKNRGSGPT